MPQSPPSVARPLAPPTDQPAENAGRRRWARVFLVGGLVAALVGTAGVVGRGFGYLAVDPVTGHLGVTLLISFALLFVAAIVTPVRRGWRNGVRIAVAIALNCALWVVCLALAWFVAFGESRYASPDGSSIVVVSEGSDGIDPMWYLDVRQSSPLLARTWELGCFNGDSFDSGLKSVHWISPTVVEVVAESGRAYQVTINPSDSRPGTTVSVGCD